VVAVSCENGRIWELGREDRVRSDAALRGDAVFGQGKLMFLGGGSNACPRTAVLADFVAN
jgi:hypothetical protein